MTKEEMNLVKMVINSYIAVMGQEKWDSLTADGAGYAFSSGLDTMDTTGYPWTEIYLYPDSQSEAFDAILCFADEENVDAFLSIFTGDHSAIYSMACAVACIAASFSLITWYCFSTWTLKSLMTFPTVGRSSLATEPRPFISSATEPFFPRKSCQKTASFSLLST